MSDREATGEAELALLRQKLAVSEAKKSQFMSCADALEDLAEERDPVRCLSAKGLEFTYECPADAPCLACRVRRRIEATEAKLVEAERRELAEAELYQQARVEELMAREKLVEAERATKAWERLAEATVAINLPRAFFWKGAEGRYLVRFAGGESAGAGSFTAAAIALAAKLGLLDNEGG